MNDIEDELDGALKGIESIIRMVVERKSRSRENGNSRYNGLRIVDALF